MKGGYNPMVERYTQEDGRRLFEEDRAAALADPQFRAIYEEEATQKELWLQLVEARQAIGLTQQQVAERMGVSQTQIARIEKRGYEAYTLRTLRRYLAALGSEFSLRIAVEHGLSAEA
jgi:predicted XRE-type DNA-binding protein